MATLGFLLVVLALWCGCIAANPGDSERCPNGLDKWMYYNIKFTLEDKTKMASASCDSDDFVVIGLLIDEIVTMIDSEYPQYEGEIIDTNVCAVPLPHSLRRGLFEQQIDSRHRALSGTYTYVGGARCRRCYRGRRDRRLGVAELVGEICSMTSIAQFAVDFCENGLSRCLEIVNDIETIIPMHEDPEKANKYKVEVEVVCEAIEDLLEEAKKQNESIDKTCTSATNARRMTLKQAENLLKIAEDMAQTALEAAQDVEAKFEDARALKGKLKEEVLKTEFKRREEQLKELLDRAKKAYEEGKRASELELKKLQEDFKRAKSLMDETELLRREADIKMMQETAKWKKMALEKELREMKDERTAAQKFGEEMAFLWLGMETASELDDWLKVYKDVLETEIPLRLFELYNTTTQQGCLDANYEEGFEVKVVMDKKESPSETFKEKCSLRP